MGNSNGHYREAVHRLRKELPGISGFSPHNVFYIREFYIRMTRKFGSSKNVLIHQIDNQSYEKSLLSQTNFDQVLTPELRAHRRLKALVAIELKIGKFMHGAIGRTD
ncbi:MAG: hypothetical protein RBS57_14715 [Desulforhabdus sp.]|nr:hypothetical protein [Desulforhabdus sp.]